MIEREIEMAEIDVEVLEVQEDRLLLTDGDIEVWVLIDKIDEESEIDGDANVGDSGVLVIPQELAEELELV